MLKKYILNMQVYIFSINNSINSIPSAYKVRTRKVLLVNYLLLKQLKSFIKVI